MMNNFMYNNPYIDELLPQYGFGDWIRENKQGVLGGLKVLGGAGLTIFGGPLGAAAGIGMMGSGMGDISSEMQGDRAAGEQANYFEQQKLMQQQATSSQKALIEQQARLQQEQFDRQVQYQEELQKGQKNIEYRQNLPQYNFQYGGEVPIINEYIGQTHEGADRGIPIDKHGTPVKYDNRKPVGLTEDGEMSWSDGNGKTYIFSNKIKYHGRAQKKNR